MVGWVVVGWDVRVGGSVRVGEWCECGWGVLGWGL